MTKRLKPGQHVIISLRQMIASGELADGERIAEIPTAAALGVSRMPVRTALRALEHEGLVTKLGNRGYAARAPSIAGVEDAIEVRGALEGLAARRVAQRGLDGAEQAAFAACLARGDAVFSNHSGPDEAVEAFLAYNLEFHDLLVRTANSRAIEVALARNNLLPFASASALALDWEQDTELDTLRLAHTQHRAVFDALVSSDADLADHLMRSHAQVATRSKPAFERLAARTD